MTFLLLEKALLGLNVIIMMMKLSFIGYPHVTIRLNFVDLLVQILLIILTQVLLMVLTFMRTVTTIQLTNLIHLVIVLF